MHTWSNEVVVEWQDIDRFEATFGEICQDAGVFGPYAWLVVCSYAADTKANLIELMLHATSVDGMDAEGRNVTATLRTECNAPKKYKSHRKSPAFHQDSSAFFSKNI